MSFRIVLVGIVLVLAILLLIDGIFTVDQRERALVLRFGAVTRADLDPGLHFKLPIAEEAKKFDGRILTLDSRPERYFTLEKKPLIVDSFVKFPGGGRGAVLHGQFRGREPGEEPAVATRERGSAQPDQPPRHARGHFRPARPAHGGNSRSS